MRHRSRRTMALVASVTFIAPVVASGAAAEAAVPILGSGSTFAEVALDAWASDLFEARRLSVDYSGNGSNGGLQNFQDRIVDFAATDVPYPEGTTIVRNFAYTPIIAAGTGLAYNLVDGTGRRIDNLRLTPQTIANIFFAKIRTWRDPAILAENPGLVDRIPDQEIRLGVRSGGSGATGVFTDFLSTTAPTEWQTFLRESGATTQANGNYTTTWPEYNASWYCYCSAFAGSSEIANWVSQSAPGSRGAIGYVEAAYAIQLNLPVVRVRNAAGNYRLPDARSVAVALLEATENGDGTQNLERVHTSPRAEAYPISSYNYLVVPTDTDFDPQKGETLREYLIYSVTVGQDKAADIGYSPLPPNLVQYALNTVNRINGHVQPPPLGDWGRAYERLTPDVPEEPPGPPPPPPTGRLVAEHADATFIRQGTRLRIAPGEVNDDGVAGEELEIDLRQERCSSQTSTVTTVSLRAADVEVDGVKVDARGGAAFTVGTYTLTGERTTTPAGRRCARPDTARAVTEPVEVELMVFAEWRNRRGSAPVEYEGEQCRGGGSCYLRDAVAQVTWSIDEGPSTRASTRSASIFESTSPLKIGAT